MMAIGVNIDENYTNKSISDILSQFSVGTENRKKNIMAPPDPSLIGAVANLPYDTLQSTEKSVMIRMGTAVCKSKKKKEKRLLVVSEDNNEETMVINSVEGEQEQLTLERNGSGVYDAIQCQTCDGGMMTQHRCQCKMPHSNIFDTTLGYNICGKAFCILCTERWGIESSSRCGHHVNQELDNSSNQPNITPTNTTIDTSSQPSTTQSKSSSSTPDYIRMQMFLEQVSMSDKEKEKSIGFELIRFRAEKQMIDKNISFSGVGQMQQQVEKDWKSLLHQAEERSSNRRPQQPKQSSSQNKTNKPTRRLTRSSTSSKKQVKRKKPHANRYCCFQGCQSTSNSNIKFIRIQQAPKPLGDNASRDKIITYQLNLERRQQQLINCGLDKNDP